MGTNYYLHYNNCEQCNITDIIHIGKCSCGWKFLFRWYYNIQNIEEYKQIMNQKGSCIIDEYDRIISYEDFWSMVEQKQNEQPHTEFLNINGYDFVNADFC